MNEFVILYVITIGILIFDSITMGLISAKLDDLEAKLNENYYDVLCFIIEELQNCADIKK